MLGEMCIIGYLFALITTSSACQEPWSIETSMIKAGSLLNFKNSSSVGQYESLTWTWVGLGGDIWENRIWYSKHDVNDIGGSFLFKTKSKNKKNTVALNWESQGNKTIKCRYDSNNIKQPGWRIVVRDVVEVNFIPLERDWVFKVGDDQVFGTGLQSLNTEDEYEYYDESRRRKRSPQAYDESEEPTEACFGSWMEKVVNFFFGDGESSRSDRGDGIFTRLGNWLRGISCSLHGPCDQPEPSDPPEGPFPRPAVTSPPLVPLPATTPPSPPTAPTLNPDAESIPELNDV